MRGDAAPKFGGHAEPRMGDCRHMPTSAENKKAQPGTTPRQQRLRAANLPFWLLCDTSTAGTQRKPTRLGMVWVPRMPIEKHHFRVIVPELVEPSHKT